VPVGSGRPGRARRARCLGCEARCTAHLAYATLLALCGRSGLARLATHSTETGSSLVAARVILCTQAQAAHRGAAPRLRCVHTAATAAAGPAAVTVLRDRLAARPVRPPGQGPGRLVPAVAAAAAARLHSAPVMPPEGAEAVAGTSKEER
jgi:hypothetical protein